MNYFLKTDKNLLTYSLIILLVIPIFGFNFFISFVGNILLLLFLIPLLLLVLVFIGFNSYKSKINSSRILPRKLTKNFIPIIGISISIINEYVKKFLLALRK